MKSRILLVGEHPLSSSGNSRMMRALLDQIDQDQYDVSVFSASEASSLTDAFEKLPFNIYEAGMTQDFGASKLPQVILSSTPQVVIFVGIDIWRYMPVWDHIKALRKKVGFIWAAIFPYDTDFVRPDWIKLIQDVNIPCVYSLAGFDLLSDHVKHIQYFRPNLYGHEEFQPFSEQKKAESRKTMFANVDPNAFIFGFVGNNQFRKDPLRAIKAYYEVSADYPNVLLYLHTTLDSSGSVFNIPQYIKDCEARYGKREFLAKQQTHQYNRKEMSVVYNVIDCLLNTSLQEGLSWTLLEAMLCKVPIIGAFNTAQKELLGEGGLGVPSDQFAFLPSYSGSGFSFIEATACNFDALTKAMRIILDDKETRQKVADAGYKVAHQWLEEVDDINVLVNYALNLKNTPQYAIAGDNKKKKILFAQHSSAGDVLMTTRCLKGLLDRHPGYALDYMTSPQYKDILVNNPYIEEVLDWDENKLQEYQFVYNPHGDRILPGHWGRNSNSLLSDFYWKILKVEPGEFYMELKEPGFGIASSIREAYSKEGKAIAIVHTTGGDPHFRTYEYMAEVCSYLRKTGYVTVQVGGKKDYPAGADIDLRGLLSFRESAWVIAHACVAITVDSFISHLCGALGISQICLFGSGNASVVKPNQVMGKLICMTPDYVEVCPGLGPCSGAVKDCPVTCTGVHDPKEIINNLKRMREEEI